MLQGRDEGLELPQEWWINGALSWSQCLGEELGEKPLCKQGLVLQGAGAVPCSGRGADGDALAPGEVPGCSAGTGPAGPAVPELCSMQAGEMLCVGSKAGTE